MVNLDITMIGKIYFYLAVCATAFFVIKLAIFSIFGMDDGHGDLVGTDVDSAFNFLSFQSILAFLMGFGWMGYASTEWNLSFKMSLLIGFGGGFVLMLLSAYLMFFVKKLNCTVKYDLNDCLNKTGKAYTKFEAKGSGKIQIDFTGKLATLDAWNETDNYIDSFKPIKVTKVEDEKLFISEIE